METYTTYKLSKKPPTFHDCPGITSVIDTKSRKFDPIKRYGQNFFNAFEFKLEGWTLLACEETPPCYNTPNISYHMNCIVITVGHVCSKERHDTKGSAIVTVGDGSIYNLQVELEPLEPLESQTPENYSKLTPENESKLTPRKVQLLSGIHGLKQALAIYKSGFWKGNWGRVVIKCTARWLAVIMTEKIPGWERNGYRKNMWLEPYYRELSRLVSELNSGSIEVLFWDVSETATLE